MGKDSDILIIGGGLAGLSTGCYAQMNGWKTHVVEHNLELGGVCTVWRREDYLIDGCIQWLMGAAEDGMFRSVYEELGVLRDVELETIDLMHRYEDPAREKVVELTRDLHRYRDDLVRLSPEDAGEVNRLLDATEKARELPSPVDRPPELASVLDRLKVLWETRHLAGTLLHFRGSIDDWCEREIRGPALRDYLRAVLLPEMPVVFLPVFLQHLTAGQMARPRGGSGAFRDAIVHRYHELGGEATVHTTVEEILVEDDRAIGVRLTDGSELRADVVVSTASAHETLMRLLGGRYLDRATKKRLDEWPTFEPVVLFNAGVEMPLGELPSSLIIRQGKPLSIGDRASDALGMQIYAGQPFAPDGHCVIQSMLPTRYEWWAQRGADYAAEKQRATEAILERMERRVPNLRGAVRMTDLATPLTFWRHTRSWNGAYEGWLPTPETFRTHVPKTAPGLAGLYFAGQWVEPGGGVPPALMSGRQLVQILCNRDGRRFRTETPS